VANTVTGDHSIWLMNGTTFQSGAYLGLIPTQWESGGQRDSMAMHGGPGLGKHLERAITRSG